jgi:hypothetical protein
MRTSPDRSRVAAADLAVALTGPARLDVHAAVAVVLLPWRHAAALAAAARRR